MSSRIILAPNHNLLSWKVGGLELLYPTTKVSGENRGGAPLCAPMFSVQSRSIPGCQLPLHGLLMYSDHGIVQTVDEQTVSVTSEFPASERFAWDFSVTTKVQAHGHTLTHTVTVTRSPHCQNPTEMPLSLGFHPYFATSQKKFTYRVDGKTIAKENIPASIIDSDFAPLSPEDPPSITTTHGTIKIEATGYDEYCLWSDNLDQYFCIEPIYQYREFGLPGTGLAAGAGQTATCTLTFTPANA